MRFLVALALLFAVTPGMPEVAESIAHAIGHGDLPHHEEDSGAGCNEHACTPLFHACGCHAAMSAQPASTTAQRQVKQDAVVDVIALLSIDDGRACEPPPLRPPIA